MPELSTEDQTAGADDADRLAIDVGRPVPEPTARRRPWILTFYGSAIGKKWVMAVTGLVLMGYVLTHMIGNLKLYLGPDEINHYGEWLRTLGEPAFPRTVALWIMRVGLLGAFLLHVHAAYSLTMVNRRARPVGYQSRRDYVAANYASLTMRITGVWLGLFVLYHLADLTWGWFNPSFERGDPYHNVVASFEVWPVAIFYILSMLALGFHLFHGAWSLFQSLGLSNPRFNRWRAYFAYAFMAVVVVGNISFPVMVLAGVIHD